MYAICYVQPAISNQTNIENDIRLCTDWDWFEYKMFTAKWKNATPNTIDKKRVITFNGWDDDWSTDSNKM